MIRPVTPSVSIVVPTRDRAPTLSRVLDSVLAQAPAGLAEVIVVDDGSRDATREILAPLARAGRLTLVEGAGRGPATARNLGLRRARAPVIAFTDDDCEVPPDWAARLVARLAETTACAVGGRLVAATDAPRPGRLSQAITSGLARALNVPATDARFLTTNNAAYRVDALLAVGGFDESFDGAAGEDRDLHARLRAKGERLVYAPEIVVRHRSLLDWKGFLSQQARYGRAARRYYADPQRRHVTAGEYARAFGAAFSEVRGADRLLMLLALPASQAAVTWGYFTRRRSAE
jgi:cellulose synthase/poly-beta-1,6-N-acetylglucosamine synthase-like glycosyltransferase